VVDFADAKISGSLFKLPAGEVAAAFGVSTFDENYRNTPDPLQAGGLLRGDPRLALVSAGRKAQAAFAEVAVPVFRGTELSAAVRHDRYSDFGNTTNGKLSLRIQPARALLIRASAGSGFRAPSLEALYATDITGFPLAIDFAGCAAAGTPRDQCTAKQIFTATTSNPNLKAEKSDAVTFGVVFEPFNGASMSLDWIQVKKQDAIEAFGLQTILDNPDAPVAGFGTARNLVRRLPNGQIDPDTSRPAVIAPTANLAKVDVESVDMNLRWAFAAGPIRWRLENTTSWLLSRTKEPLPGLAVQEFAGLAGFPQWRNAFSVNAIWGAFEATAFVRRVAGFDDITDPSARTAATRKVSSWSTTDLTLSHHGLVTKGTRIDFVVKNVADRMPPLSAALNTANKIDFNHSAVGRFFQVSLKLEY
jgi:iron complex outermembrane recepter protein